MKYTIPVFTKVAIIKTIPVLSKLFSTLFLPKIKSGLKVQKIIKTKWLLENEIFLELVLMQATKKPND